MKVNIYSIYSMLERAASMNKNMLFRWILTCYNAGKIIFPKVFHRSTTCKYI